MRQLRSIPSAAQRANKADTRGELTRLEVCKCALVAQQRAFRNKDLERASRPAFIALVREIERMLSGIHRSTLRSCLLLQHAQVGEPVFNFIERPENRGPICRRL